MEEKIKIFLDSNVLFSIAYSGREKSRAYLIYDIQEADILEVYISGIVSEEAMLNIRNKRPSSLSFLQELIQRSKILSDVMVDSQNKQISKLPQNDRIILTTALYHEMSFFITGNDKDFKAFYNKRIHNTLILKPADFVNRRF